MNDSNHSIALASFSTRAIFSQDIILLTRSHYWQESQQWLRLLSTRWRWINPWLRKARSQRATLQKGASSTQHRQAYPWTLPE